MLFILSSSNFPRIHLKRQKLPTIHNSHSLSQICCFFFGGWGSAQPSSARHREAPLLHPVVACPGSGTLALCPASTQGLQCSWKVGICIADGELPGEIEQLPGDPKSLLEEMDREKGT